MSAVSQMLSTVELLENVLIFLPMKDLLLAQRVCRLWKDVINGSIAFQKRLFVFPAASIADIQGIKEPALESSACMTVQANPLLIGPFSITSTLTALETEGPQERTFQLHLRKRDLDVLMKHPEASWRRMLVSQPPCEYRLVVGSSETDPFNIGEGWRGVSVSLPLPAEKCIGEAVQLFKTIHLAEREKVVRFRELLKTARRRIPRARPERGNSVAAPS